MSMADELVEEWRKLLLTSDEGTGFTVDNDAMGNAEVIGAHCLLGKLLTDKFFKKNTLKSTMLRLWGATRGIMARDIRDNLFVFQF